MGVVFRGHDRATGRQVAVKLLRPLVGVDIQRFAREVRALAQLRHPGIVAYLAHGTTERGEHYLVMEWLEGEDLSRRLLRERLSASEALRLGLGIAHALDAAHACGIVHRDLKPSNVFLCGGSVEDVRLLDFGIVRLLGSKTEVTRTGEIVGTPGYLAPEQARGARDVDGRADLFGLGGVLFKSLSGQAPFEAEGELAAMLKLATEEAPRLSELCAGVPEALVDLIARLLAKDRAHRPADARAVAVELARISSEGVETVPPASDCGARKARVTRRVPDPFDVAASPYVALEDPEDVTEMDDPLVVSARARLGHVLRSKWRLDALLGVGGMASVYDATHRNGVRGAVKVLHADLSADADIRNRFLREGYVANKVKHPGVVLVLDDDVAEDGSVFLVMELIEGQTLAERVAALPGGRMELAEVLAIAEPLLDVLAAAHDVGVVHRDLKPENLFLTRSGTLKVLDFGIARLRVARARDATSTGVVLGTPAFMAPEQALGLGDDVDGRTDLWAVGATMFTLLTGRLVHDATTHQSLLTATATTPAPSIATVLPGLPPSTCALVDRALAFNRADRWPDARAMLQAVREAWSDLGPPALPPLDRPVPSSAPGLPPSGVIALSRGNGLISSTSGLSTRASAVDRAASTNPIASRRAKAIAGVVVAAACVSGIVSLGAPRLSGRALRAGGGGVAEAVVALASPRSFDGDQHVDVELPPSPIAAPPPKDSPPASEPRSSKRKAASPRTRPASSARPADGAAGVVDQSVFEGRQ